MYAVINIATSCKYVTLTSLVINITSMFIYISLLYLLSQIVLLSFTTHVTNITRITSNIHAQIA